MPAGWIDAIRFGKIPEIKIRARDRSELPAGYCLRKTDSISRACNAAMFIGLMLLVIIILLLD